MSEPSSSPGSGSSGQARTFVLDSGARPAPTEQSLQNKAPASESKLLNKLLHFRKVDFRSFCEDERLNPRLENRHESILPALLNLQKRYEQVVLRKIDMVGRVQDEELQALIAEDKAAKAQILRHKIEPKDLEEIRKMLPDRQLNPDEITTTEVPVPTVVASDGTRSSADAMWTDISKETVYGATYRQLPYTATGLREATALAEAICFDVVNAFREAGYISASEQRAITYEVIASAEVRRQRFRPE